MPGRRRRRVCRNLRLPLLMGLSRRFSAPRLRRKQRGAESHSQSHSRESLEGKVLSLLAADCPMSRFELSRRLGQKKISGQLNKVIRLPVFSPVSRSGAGAKLGFFRFSQ